MMPIRKRRKMTAEINVVPYIDVMLVLLIIFMATAPFVTQGVDVELPQTSTAQSAAELANDEDNARFIIVEIDHNGSLGLSINNAEMVRNITLQDLLISVKAELVVNPTASVLIGGDGRVPYAEVIGILDSLNNAGITSVGLMTDSKA